LIGTVEIGGCRTLEKSDGKAACFDIIDIAGFYAWLLERPERAENLQTPQKRPQPVFCNSF
jgi:hypothetical protein